MISSSSAEHVECMWQTDLLTAVQQARSYTHAVVYYHYITTDTAHTLRATEVLYCSKTNQQQCSSVKLLIP
jgi:hypothetical protein